MGLRYDCEFPVVLLDLEGGCHLKMTGRKKKKRKEGKRDGRRGAERKEERKGGRGKERWKRREEKSLSP